MSKQEVVLDSIQEGLLALMRTKGLSIKDLDGVKKAQLREFLDYLHNTKGMSLNDIAKLVGNKTSGYTSWVCRQLGVRSRPFEEARLRGIREKRRKYERRPFDGTDEDKAYLLGLRHGDLSVSKPWKGVVRVSTSTTHPAMAELFRSPGYRIEMKKDYWRVMVARFEECQAVLRALPLRHAEKVSKKALAISLVLGQQWKVSGPSVESIRASIRAARDSFVADAERAFQSNPRHHVHRG